VKKAYPKGDIVLLVVKLLINKGDRWKAKSGSVGEGMKQGGVLSYPFILCIEELCFFKMLLVTAP
jgi:hypothetical protein